jgi:hypothetical protein
MARFETDSYFPEPMWGQKQREVQLGLPSFEMFFTQLQNRWFNFPLLIFDNLSKLFYNSK